MGNRLPSSEMLVFTTEISNKIGNWSNNENVQLKITEKNKERLHSGARNAYVTITSKGYKPYEFDVNNLVNVFQQVAFLPINPNSYPAQSYFKIQKVNQKPTLVYDLQGDGWETLLKVYGEDVQKVRSWTIREGDVFSGIEYLGTEIVPPKIRLATDDEIRQMGLHKTIRKVKSVVYAIWTSYGIEWYVANREDLKANIIAQAKNNGAGVEIQREMANYSIDEILDPEGKFLEMQTKNAFGKTAKILSPTYRDPSSVEGMIITKLKKYICNKYSKDFDRDPDNRNRGDVIKAIYQETLHEDKYTDEISSDLILKNSEEAFDTEANKENVKIEKSGEKFEVKEEQEEPKQEVKTEKPKPEKEKVDKKEKAEMPDWM
jgi:hypothetical protein